jgi:integrase
VVVVQLKGVHVVSAKGRTYHYAWRGGPRLPGEPGSPAYVASYTEAHKARKQPPTANLRALVTAFKASPEFAMLGDHTKRAYRTYLDAIDKEFGDLPFGAVDDPDVVDDFYQWRDGMAGSPRSADYAVGTLKRLLAWGMKRRRFNHENHAEGIERLHRVNKADAIWTADDLTAFERAASKELVWAVQLAMHTGLRQSDLIRLAWNHESGGAFGYLTSKRGKFVTIPITPGCRALLGRIEKRGPVILTTERGKRPWTADGLRSSFGKACKDAGVKRTFHDLRRTAATTLVAAGIDNTQVAAIMGWSEDDVEAMKRKYVSRAAIVSAVLAKLEKGG